MPSGILCCSVSLLSMPWLPSWCLHLALLCPGFFLFTAYCRLCPLGCLGYLPVACLWVVVTQFSLACLDPSCWLTLAGASVGRPCYGLAVQLGVLFAACQVSVLVVVLLGASDRPAFPSATAVCLCDWCFCGSLFIRLHSSFSCLSSSCLLAGSFIHAVSVQLAACALALHGAVVLGLVSEMGLILVAFSGLRGPFPSAGCSLGALACPVEPVVLLAGLFLSLGVLSVILWPIAFGVYPIPCLGADASCAGVRSLACLPLGMVAVLCLLYIWPVASGLGAPALVVGLAPCTACWWVPGTGVFYMRPAALRRVRVPHFG